jgi:uncharacterized membrane protein
MNMHTPPTLEKLKQMRKAVRNVNLERKEKLSGLDNLAFQVTKRVGTFGFFLIILFWTVLWVGWNVFAPTELRFDPYPAFVVWILFSNMIQIMLLPLIMIGQNLQNMHSETRADADFEINIKSEREIETILQHLENQNELILKITKQLEKRSN